MSDEVCEAGFNCTIRCMDPDAVAAARRQLHPDEVRRVAYVCKLSGRQEYVAMLGSRLAARLDRGVPEADDPLDARILAALADAELCECDVATLLGLADSDVGPRLSRLCAAGSLSRRMLQQMNYYRVEPDDLKHRVASILGEGESCDHA